MMQMLGITGNDEKKPRGQNGAAPTGSGPPQQKAKKRDTSMGKQGTPECEGKKGPPVNLGRPNKHPLEIIEVVELISSHLSFEELQKVRLINRFWFKCTAPAWNKKSRVVLNNIVQIREFVLITSNTKQVLPFTTHFWSFQGDAIPKLMDSEGHCEREQLKPFWSSVHTLALENWTRTRWRYERGPAPNYATQRVPYQEVIRKGSAYHVNQLLQLCTNVTTLIIHYPLLSKIKGAYIGPRQFPQLEKVLKFEIYMEGKQFNPNLVETDDFDELVVANIRNAGEGVDLPRPRRRPDRTGGETIVLRILDHIPNARHVIVNCGTLITTAVENWAARLFIMTGTSLRIGTIAPKMTKLLFSIPLKENICKGFTERKWPLRNLHLRLLPGNDYRINDQDLHDMIGSFGETLLHLEIVFLCARGGMDREFHSSTKLQQLKSIEIWGYNGFYNFLHDLRTLRKADVGVLELNGAFEKTRDWFALESFPNVEINIFSRNDFFQRVNQGPIFPDL